MSAPSTRRLYCRQRIQNNMVSVVILNIMQLFLKLPNLYQFIYVFIFQRLRVFIFQEFEYIWLKTNSCQELFSDFVVYVFLVLFDRIRNKNWKGEQVVTTRSWRRSQSIRSARKEGNRLKSRDVIEEIDFVLYIYIYICVL